MRIAIVGSRGMVGQVLMKRIFEEGGLDKRARWDFFSTTQANHEMAFGGKFKDARDASLFYNYDVIVTCQGGFWTMSMYPQIMQMGWKGIWLDASSALRMEKVLSCLTLSISCKSNIV